jgi:hypothetical protein
MTLAPSACRTCPAPALRLCGDGSTRTGRPSADKCSDDSLGKAVMVSPGPWLNWSHGREVDGPARPTHGARQGR